MVYARGVFQSQMAHYETYLAGTRNETTNLMMTFFQHFAISILMVLLFSHTYAQNKTSTNFYNQIKTYDLTSVFNPDSIKDDDNEKYKHSDPLGFIDTTFQRFQIHFTSITKSKTNAYLYNVIGKTKVKNIICSFSGTIRVIEALIDTSALLNDYCSKDYRQGFIKTQVDLFENKKEPASGIITGVLTTDFYLDENGIMFYNALMLVADGFSNNQFEGKWKSYKTGKIKKCNWGDFRIPDCGNLDFGTGEFSVNDKFVIHGWENYQLAWGYNPGKPQVREARLKEEEQWWK